MDNYLSPDFLENYESADVILTLLFAFVDFIILLFSLFNLKSINKKIYLLKNKLFAIIIIDIIIRLLYAKKYYKINSLFKEFLFSFLTSFQFCLILSFLEQSYENSKKSKKSNFYKALKKKQLWVLFILITFPYSKFSYSEKKICFVQCLIIIYCVLVLYSLLKSKFIKMLNNILEQVTIGDKNIIHCIYGSPLPCMILFISYYILKITFLPISNQDCIIYSNIILIIIKECSKYFLLFILEILLHINENKNKIEKELFYNDFNSKDARKRYID